MLWSTHPPTTSRSAPKPRLGSAVRLVRLVRPEPGRDLAGVEAVSGRRPQPVENAGQTFPLGLGQTGEDLVQRRLPLRPGPAKLGRTRFGDPKHGRPAVVRVRLADEQAVGFQGVDHRSDGARYDAQSVCELAHSLRAVRFQRGQQGGAGECQTAVAVMAAPVLGPRTSPQQLTDADKGLGQRFRIGTDGLVGQQGSEAQTPAAEAGPRAAAAVVVAAGPAIAVVRVVRVVRMVRIVVRVSGLWPRVGGGVCGLI